VPDWLQIILVMAAYIVLMRWVAAASGHRHLNGKTPATPAARREARLKAKPGE